MFNQIQTNLNQIVHDFPPWACKPTISHFLVAPSKIALIICEDNWFIADIIFTTATAISNFNNITTFAKLVFSFFNICCSFSNSNLEKSKAWKKLLHKKEICSKWSLSEIGYAENKVKFNISGCDYAICVCNDYLSWLAVWRWNKQIYLGWNPSVVLRLISPRRMKVRLTEPSL